MEVKKGYKQTELGVIPEDWTVRVFGSVCDVRDGTHESPKFLKKGVPFLMSRNLVNGRLDLDNVSYISKSDATQFNKRSKVDRNDILMAMIGTIGRAVLVNFEPHFCFKNMALFKPKKGDPSFLIQLINSPIFQMYLFDNMDGGIQKFVSLASLRTLLIPLPNISEQRAIAKALSDVDELIDSLEKLIAKKRDIKQATMQQLLIGKTRLPGFTGEWKMKCLGDVLRVCHGKSQHEVVVESGKYPILATGGEIGRTNQFLHDKPSVLIGRKGTIDAPQYVDTPFWTIDTLFFTEISNLASPKYIFFLFNMINWRNYNEASGVPSLNASTIESIEVTVPKLDEQTAIAEVLSDMDAEIEALEARRNKTKALKQGMMQELLTGKTRLI